MEDRRGERRLAVSPLGAFLQRPREVLGTSAAPRQYKGQLLQVTVRENGFEYQGTTYPSLSAAANAITGSHTNGYQFFRLGQYEGEA